MKKQFTNHMQNQVMEFNKAFGHPTNDKPTLVDIERFTNRQIWGAEESIEGIHALAKDMEEFKQYFKIYMNGLKDAYHAQLEKFHPTSPEAKLVAVADAVVDGLYFKLGDGVELGVDLELVMNHVQNSNMSKLFEDEDGNLYPQYRDDGKVKKSPRFFEPEPKIKEEIENQIKGRKSPFAGIVDISEIVIETHNDESLLSKESTVELLNDINNKSISSVTIQSPKIEKASPKKVKEVIEKVLENKGDSND